MGAQRGRPWSRPVAAHPGAALQGLCGFPCRCGQGNTSAAAFLSDRLGFWGGVGEAEGPAWPTETGGAGICLAQQVETRGSAGQGRQRRPALNIQQPRQPAEVSLSRRSAPRPRTAPAAASDTAPSRPAAPSRGRRSPPAVWGLGPAWRAGLRAGGRRRRGHGRPDRGPGVG
jgi:hypothetical protein